MLQEIHKEIRAIKEQLEYIEHNLSEDIKVYTKKTKGSLCENCQYNKRCTPRSKYGIIATACKQYKPRKK